VSGNLLIQLQQTTSTFSQKLKCECENIWRNVVHIDNLNNVSSNLFQNMLSRFSRRHGLEQTTRHHLLMFSQKPRYEWENIWRKVVLINNRNNVTSNLFQNIRFSRRHISRWKAGEWKSFITPLASADDIDIFSKTKWLMWK
jgi:hypothetical protein